MRFLAAGLLLLSLSVPAPVVGQSDPPGYYFSTLTGRFGGGIGSTVDGGPAIARFDRPWGIAVDAQGDLYVTEVQGHVVRKISPDGFVTTLAGSPGQVGTVDGVGARARFAISTDGRPITLVGPFGIAVDPVGNVYVADGNSHTLRAIAPDALVTTFSGQAGGNGHRDGNVADALFRLPLGIASDAAGTLFVADTYNHVIRMIERGVVTTIAGTVGAAGTSDGVGAAARFLHPTGVAVSRAGNLYVTDSSNIVRRISRSATMPNTWVVTTLAGTAFTFGTTDGQGGDARFGIAPTPSSSPTGNTIGYSGWAPIGLTPALIGRSYRVGDLVGVAVDTAENVYVADVSNHTIRRITPAGVVSTIGGSPTVIGATDGRGAEARFNRPTGIAIDAADTLFITDSSNNRICKGVVDNTRIANLSIRTALAGADPLLVGFVAAGGSKSLLVRASGPALRTFGVASAMGDPQLVLQSGGAVLASNDNWSVATNATEIAAVSAEVGAFPLEAASLDAAVLATVASEPVTVQASARDNNGGVVLVELYDAGGSGSARLINVSTRAVAGVGENALFAGFVVTGNTPRTLLIRAIGPTLSAFGVTTFLADPFLEILPAGSSLVRNANDNWGGSAALVSAFGRVGAFALPAASSRDAVLLLTLTAGAYTARVSGVGNTTGEVLLEIYDVR